MIDYSEHGKRARHAAEAAAAAAVERMESDERVVNRTCVLHSVHREMQRQQRLKAEGRFQFTCRDPEMSHAARLTVLVEEVGEVARAILEDEDRVNDKHLVNLRKELVQVAAVALSWVEGMDERDPPEEESQVELPFVGGRVEGEGVPAAYDIASAFPDLPHFADTEAMVMKGHASECIKGPGHLGPCSIPAARVIAPGEALFTIRDGKFEQVRPAQDLGEAVRLLGAAPFDPKSGLADKPRDRGKAPSDWHSPECPQGGACYACGRGTFEAPDDPATAVKVALAEERSGTPTVYVEGSKYIFSIPKNDYRVHVLRHAEPWLIITQGSKAICAMMYEHDDFRTRAFHASRQLESLAASARKVQQPLSHVVMCACLANQGHLCATCFQAIWDQMFLTAPRSR